MAAPDKLGIINLALLQLKEKPLTSLEDSDNPTAVVANHFYQQCLDELTQNHTWNCARARTTVTLSTTVTPAFDFVGAYELPNDCLKIHHVGTENEQWTADTKWRHDIEGRHLLYGFEGEDAPESLQVEYTRSLSDTTKMDALFVRALRTYLAQEMAMPITGDPKIAMLATQIHTQALREALAINHQQRMTRVIERNPIAEARYTDSVDMWDGQLRVPPEEWPS